MIQLSLDIQAALGDSQVEPLKLRDPQTGKTYILVSEEEYQLLRCRVAEPSLTDMEQDRLLAELGAEYGWDDEAMDVYNELDPRKNQ